VAADEVAMEFPLRLLIVEDGEADARLMIGALPGCAKSRSGSLLPAARKPLKICVAAGPSSTALSPIEEM
jgi:hypothetical protein